MGDEAKYASALKPGRGTVIAMVLVAAWVGIATFVGGFPLGFRAFMLFAFPLTFVWIPEVMVRPDPYEARKHFSVNEKILPAALRLAGWAFILGIPAVWAVFYVSLR